LKHITLILAEQTKCNPNTSADLTNSKH